MYQSTPSYRREKYTIFNNYTILRYNISLLNDRPMTYLYLIHAIEGVYIHTRMMHARNKSKVLF